MIRQPAKPGLPFTTKHEAGQPGFFTSQPPPSCCNPLRAGEIPGLLSRVSPPPFSACSGSPGLLCSFRQTPCRSNTYPPPPPPPPPSPASQPLRSVNMQATSHPFRLLSQLFSFAPLKRGGNMNERRNCESRPYCYRWLNGSFPRLANSRAERQ